MSRNLPAKSFLSPDDYQAQIQAIYRQNPHVRINIALSHSKVVQDAEATIVGVYRHCFCVEELTSGTPIRHTFTYTDLLTRRVDIQPVSS